MSDLKGELENLLKSPGWLWLEQDAKARWDAELANYLAQAANHENDQLALQRIRQVIASQKAVQQVFARPKEKVRELSEPAPPDTYSRRGAL